MFSDGKKELNGEPEKRIYHQFIEPSIRRQFSTREKGAHLRTPSPHFAALPHPPSSDASEHELHWIRSTLLVMTFFVTESVRDSPDFLFSPLFALFALFAFSFSVARSFIFVIRKCIAFPTIQRKEFRRRRSFVWHSALVRCEREKCAQITLTDANLPALLFDEAERYFGHRRITFHVDYESASFLPRLEPQLTAF